MNFHFEQNKVILPFSLLKHPSENQLNLILSIKKLTGQGYLNNVYERGASTLFY